MQHLEGQLAYTLATEAQEREKLSAKVVNLPIVRLAEVNAA